jgi:hypothetical protein
MRTTNLSFEMEIIAAIETIARSGGKHVGLPKQADLHSNAPSIHSASMCVQTKLFFFHHFDHLIKRIIMYMKQQNEKKEQKNLAAKNQAQNEQML